MEVVDMKHIISFFARKPSKPGKQAGLSFVRLPTQAGTLAGPVPIALNYLANAKLRIHKEPATGGENDKK